MRDLILLVLWLLPASRIKNRMLTLCGHRISREASARSNLVWRVRAFEMAPHARINRWNLIKGLKAIRLSPFATIGRYNVISAHASYGQLPGGARLELGEHSYVTSRQSIDCSGSFVLGAFSALAGFGSQVLTHSIDLSRDAQTAYPVVIGERSFVGARCLLLGGSRLPSRSILAAGSVLTDAARTEQGLWAGVPARFKTQVKGQWFERTVGETLDLYIPEHDRTVVSGI